MLRAGRTLAAAAIAFAAATAFLWMQVPAGGGSSSSPNAALSVPRSADEGAIVQSLLDAGVDEVLGETTQWLWINDFGEWERVPLASFRERIESFDPRDSGYADRLRSFFVSGDERLLILRERSSPFGEGGAFLARAAASALGDVPHRLKVGSSTRSDILPYLLAFAAAIALAFRAKSFAPLAALPALLALAPFGAGALVVSGLLCAASGNTVRAFSEALRPAAAGLSLRARNLFSVGLPAVAAPALFILIAPPVGIPLPAAAAASLSVLFAQFSAAAAAELLSRRRGHRRFMPVALVRNARAGFRSFSASIGPFAASALALALLQVSGVSSAAQPLAAFPPPAFGFADFESHMDTQRSFLSSSVMDAGEKKRYTLFSIGDDGFSAVSDRVLKGSTAPRPELPPLERFLLDSGFAETGVRRRSAASLFELEPIFSWIAIFAALACSAPSFISARFRRRSTKADSTFADKRIAA